MATASIFGSAWCYLQTLILTIEIASALPQLKRTDTNQEIEITQWWEHALIKNRKEMPHGEIKWATRQEKVSQKLDLTGVYFNEL